MSNFVKICRSIQEHWIYKDSDYFKLWFEMLANARYLNEPKTDMHEKIVYTLHRGEFIFGRVSWSKRLGIGEQKIRTFIKKLLKEDMIREVHKTPKFTIYFIVNYEKYNQQTNQQLDIDISGLQGMSNQQNNQQVTITQPSPNQQITTNKESKEGCKKVKKDINYIIDDFTSNADLKEAIKDFIDMRKQIKKPMTDRAIKLLLRDLNKLSSDDGTKIEILNQSIQNCWKGIFPLKKEGQHGSNTGNNQQNKGKYAGIRVKTKEHNISESDYADLI